MNLLLRHYVLTVGRTANVGGKPVRLVRALQVPLELALGHLEATPTTELRRMRNDIDAVLDQRAAREEQTV